MKGILGGVGLILVGVITWWLTEGFSRWSSNETASSEYSQPPVGSPTSGPDAGDERLNFVMSEDEVGIDRPGKDLKDFVAADIAECKSACLADQSCNAVSFNVSSKQCWMKETVPLRTEQAGFTSAVKRASAVM